MRGPSSPYLQMQQYLEHYLNGVSWRPLSFEEQRYVEKIKQAIAEQQRKFYAKILNPFNLCPKGLIIWFPVLPSVAIGVSFSSLQEISIYIRQAMDPTFLNIFSIFKILEFQVPFPLALLTMFSAVGLTINGKINKLVQTSNNEIMTEQAEGLKDLDEKLEYLSTEEGSAGEKILETMVEEKRKSIIEALNPFNLSPRSLTVLFPFQKYTSVVVVFHDLDYMAIGISQALEPNAKIISVIRFIHVQVPFALNLLAMFLLIGLFFSGGVYKIEQGAREEVIKEVKESVNQLKKKY